ncbi:MAG TPA: hypothetical protein VH230_10955, partial [Stellaceae bacterium]|nr:hypothetical protein [Stellaceae bacterium]
DWSGPISEAMFNPVGAEHVTTIDGDALAVRTVPNSTAVTSAKSIAAVKWRKFMGCDLRLLLIACPTGDAIERAHYLALAGVFRMT